MSLIIFSTLSQYLYFQLAYFMNDAKINIVRNLRLIQVIQPMVITLGGVNRMMVSFRKFKQVNAKENYMQVYNNQYIDNCI